MGQQEELEGSLEKKMSVLTQSKTESMQNTIALMNEMSVFCHDLGLDLWASIAAAIGATCRSS